MLTETKKDFELLAIIDVEGVGACFTISAIKDMVDDEDIAQLKGENITQILEMSDISFRAPVDKSKKVKFSLKKS